MEGIFFTLSFRVVNFFHPLLTKEGAGGGLFNMTDLFNRSEMKRTRQSLRNDATFAERVLWQSLRGSQLMGVKFRRQCSIDSFIVDFYAPRLRLAIEVDGISHEGQTAQDRDTWRQKIIENYGITFLRFSDVEVTSLPEVVTGKIAEVIQEMLKRS